MIKNPKIFLYSLIFLFSKTVFASSSASFLIAQTAFNDYDFGQVLYEYSSKENLEYKSDYLDELISAVITENIILAEKISNKILLNDPSNQEAKLLLMVKFVNSNKKKKIKELLISIFDLISLLLKKINSNKSFF